jgi:repressor LexA
MNAPTDRQLEVLEFMRRYQREHSMPPTLREICTEFSWKAHFSAISHLRALAKKGLVQHRPNVSRGWLALQPSQTDEVGA